MDGLTEGRLVHYVLGEGHSKGEHRPALVVKLWRTGDGKPPENGCANLSVFTDWDNDFFPSGDGHPHLGAIGMFWATSVVYSENPKPFTWHWIEQA